MFNQKNVLLSVITTDIETAAIGDLIYGLIILFIYEFTIKRFILYTLFTITGGLIVVSISVILNSLSFWINKADMFADTFNDLIIHFDTYPDGIYKGIVKILLYTIIPIGIVNYIPIRILTKFNLQLTLLVILVCIILVTLAFTIFNK